MSGARVEGADAEVEKPAEVAKRLGFGKEVAGPESLNDGGDHPDPGTVEALQAELGEWNLAVLTGDHLAEAYHEAFVELIDGLVEVPAAYIDWEDLSGEVKVCLVEAADRVLEKIRGANGP